VCSSDSHKLLIRRTTPKTTTEKLFLCYRLKCCAWDFSIVITNWRGSDKLRRTLKLGREFIENSINVTFWGGFAVDADFTDGFSGSIEGPEIAKNR
jgi:hypothetical protein